MSLVVDLPVAELTLDEVAALAAADPDHRYELQEGTLLVIPPPDREHAAILMDLGSWLRTVGFARNRYSPRLAYAFRGATTRTPSAAAQISLSAGDRGTNPTPRCGSTRLRCCLWWRSSRPGLRTLTG